MKVTVIPIVIGELGTIPKALENRLDDLEISGRSETIQSYLPTPPPGQDMTQGQFLSWV